MGNQVRVAIVGSGGWARYHIRRMVQQQETTEIVAICEPSPEAYALAAAEFEEAGLTPPPNIPALAKLIEDYQPDAALITTPHVYHHEHATTCLEAGVDVMVEKPMVMNAAEAESLISTRDRTGRLLVVAFQGGLSPQIREAVRMLRAGELGEMLNISGNVWQNWKNRTTGKWRQVPEIAGGGFMFDTGAHMLNTVCDLAGEDFTHVAAWLDNRSRDVDILATIMGQLKSGAYVTITGSGDTIHAGSDIRVFCTEGIVQTGVWGERLLVQRDGEKEASEVELPESLGAWEQFVQVRNGEIPNPCPAEVGLRMARLWDAIKASAAQNGVPVNVMEVTT